MSKYKKGYKVIYDDLVWYVIQDYGELVKIGRSENNYQITCKVKRNNLLPVTSEIQKQADELASAKIQIAKLEKQLEEKNAIVICKNGGMYIGNSIDGNNKLMRELLAEEIHKAIIDAAHHARNCAYIFPPNIDPFKIVRIALGNVERYGEFLLAQSKEKANVDSTK